MTTTLYLIAQITWHTFRIFEGEDQIEKCKELKQQLEKKFPVEATCVTKSDTMLVHNNKGYFKNLATN